MSRRGANKSQHKSHNNGISRLEEAQVVFAGLREESSYFGALVVDVNKFDSRCR